MREIKIGNGGLGISTEQSGYLVCNQELSIFVHTDKFKLVETWLKMYTENDVYIGRVWIESVADMKKVKKFLRETK